MYGQYIEDPMQNLVAAHIQSMQEASLCLKVAALLLKAERMALPTGSCVAAEIGFNTLVRRQDDLYWAADDALLVALRSIVSQLLASGAEPIKAGHHSYSQTFTLWVETEPNDSARVKAAS